MNEGLTSKTVTLPTWDECAKAVDGGYATHLQTFIYHNEPSDTGADGFQTEAEFRRLLALMIEYERQPIPQPPGSLVFRCKYPSNCDCCGPNREAFTAIEGEIQLLRDAVGYWKSRYEAEHPETSDDSEITPHGVIFDKLGWCCSVCGGWNHARDALCTHTHSAVKS